MGILGLLIFAGVYAMAVASPGPGVAAIIARGLGHGVSGAPAFILGFIIGDLVWLTFAVGGLAVIAQTYAPLFLAIKYAGAAYLLYLAYKLWTARGAVDDVAGNRTVESNWKVFAGSLVLTLGNPKVMVFFLAILPTVVDLQAITLLGYLEIAAVAILVMTLVMSGYTLLAARARKLIKSPKAVEAVNKVSGVGLAAAAIAVATR
jgi:threonine/homoserine/homoserine lactone efflux protein